MQALIRQEGAGIMDEVPTTMSARLADESRTGYSQRHGPLVCTNNFHRELGLCVQAGGLDQAGDEKFPSPSREISVLCQGRLHTTLPILSHNLKQEASRLDEVTEAMNWIMRALGL